MKKMFFALLLLTAIQWPSYAQSARNEFEVIKEVFKSEKKTVVAGFLNLNDEEAAKFWPIYEKYEAERNYISVARFNNIMAYVEKYSTLTNEDADALATKGLKLLAEEVDLKKKYYKKVKKVLSPAKAASFIQLEDYIQVAVRTELYEMLPLMVEKN